MPTSLTAPVLEDPNFTFAQFVWLSTRQMMVAILLRDSPWRVPTEADIAAAISESEIAQAQAALDQASAELAAMEVRSDADWAADVTAYHSRVTSEHKRSVQHHSERCERASRMLAQVVEWMPPTNDHVSFKSEMVRQLQAEIYEVPDAPVELSAVAYREEMLQGARRRVAWRVQDVENATRRVSGRKAWFEALKASVPLP